MSPSPAVPLRLPRAAARIACLVLALVLCAPTAASAADWLSYGSDLSNTRSQPAPGPIGLSTAGALTPSWASRQTGFQAGVTPLPYVTGTPAVHNGVAFWGDYRGTLRAVDVATGAARWTTQVGTSAEISIRQVNTSPAVGGGLVVVSTGDGRVVALDEASGAVRWSTVIESEAWSVLYGSPVIAGGRVVVGTSSVQNAVDDGPWTFRGSIVSLDLNTGALQWRRYTQRPGQDGAGGSVWSTPAVDSARGLVYVGTGNAYERPVGPYTDALMALRIDSGEIAWSRQFTIGDVFNYYYGLFGRDYDIGASPNLFSIGSRAVVGVGDKAGRYAVLDRATGEVVWRRQLCRGSHLGGIMTTAAVAHDSIFVTCNQLRNTFELADPNNTTHVIRLGKYLGVTRWDKSVPGGTAGAVSEAGGVVFVPNTLGTVRGFDWRNGNQLWSARPAGASTRQDYGTAGGISVAGDRVLVPYGYGFNFTAGPPDAVGGVVAYAVPATRAARTAARAAAKRSSARALPGGRLPSAGVL